MISNVSSIEQCSKSLYDSLVQRFTGIPLLDYYNPQYIKGSYNPTELIINPATGVLFSATAHQLNAKIPLAEQPRNSPPSGPREMC